MPVQYGDNIILKLFIQKLRERLSGVILVNDQTGGPNDFTKLLLTAVYGKKKQDELLTIEAGNEMVIIIINLACLDGVEYVCKELTKSTKKTFSIDTKSWI